MNVCKQDIVYLCKIELFEEELFYRLKMSSGLFKHINHIFDIFV